MLLHAGNCVFAVLFATAVWVPLVATATGSGATITFTRNDLVTMSINTSFSLLPQHEWLVQPVQDAINAVAATLKVLPENKRRFVWEGRITCDGQGETATVSCTGPGDLDVPASHTTCGSSHMLRTDLALYVVERDCGANTASSSDSTSPPILASAAVCRRGHRTGRPTAGVVRLCSTYLASRSPERSEQWDVARLVLHELVHVLVFDPSSMFRYLRCDTGQNANTGRDVGSTADNPATSILGGNGNGNEGPMSRQEGAVTQNITCAPYSVGTGGLPTLDGVLARVSGVGLLATPRVQVTARRHFGCTSTNEAPVFGLPLEMEGSGDGVASSAAGRRHFEERVLGGGELLGPRWEGADREDARLSTFVTALLADSGWYFPVDVGYAVQWGAGDGCGVIQPGVCLRSPTPGHCPAANATVCHPNGRHKARCTITPFSDECPIPVVVQDGSCQYPHTGSALSTTRPLASIAIQSTASRCVDAIETPITSDTTATPRLPTTSSMLSSVPTCLQFACLGGRPYFTANAHAAPTRAQQEQQSPSSSSSDSGDTRGRASRAWLHAACHNRTRALLFTSVSFTCPLWGAEECEGHWTQRQRHTLSLTVTAASRRTAASDETEAASTHTSTHMSSSSNSSNAFAGVDHVRTLVEAAFNVSRVVNASDGSNSSGGSSTMGRVDSDTPCREQWYVLPGASQDHAVVYVVDGSGADGCVDLDTATQRLMALVATAPTLSYATDDPRHRPSRGAASSAWRWALVGVVGACVVGVVAVVVRWQPPSAYHTFTPRVSEVVVGHDVNSDESTVVAKRGGSARTATGISSISMGSTSNSGSSVGWAGTTGGCHVADKATDGDSRGPTDMGATGAAGGATAILGSTTARQAWI
ncbi:hypothetical protein PTSG_02281 [Salpingoeca rosetta]|uniref:Leishmanolysin-like peptidase n=1 Tax=Salpingoeca rosetta (strain ATCC 50818 / BSB-021) TaxID=946362 RepID=F2U1R4_SALR5|nr:uncharacterized protein PTSG_02281 [Salpingoeca rosetta]EGD81566.1 hypothetical protein PTSG_02281 [Salpingoeca rosetta]|eukprot:XP_004996770.1 hypothetical protein PTSG_02281 [Salpingoeca rosetta]